MGLATSRSSGPASTPLYIPRRLLAVPPSAGAARPRGHEQPVTPLTGEGRCMTGCESWRWTGDGEGVTAMAPSSPVPGIFHQREPSASYFPALQYHTTRMQVPATLVNSGKAVAPDSRAEEGKAHLTFPFERELPYGLSFCLSSSSHLLRCPGASTEELAMQEIRLLRAGTCALMGRRSVDRGG